MAVSLLNLDEVISGRARRRSTGKPRVVRSEDREDRVKFAIAFANVGPFATAEGATRMAVAAEAAGIESIWTVEHIIWPDEYNSTYPYSPEGKMPGSSDQPMPDPLVWLAYVAANTTTLRLATGVSLLPERHPLVFGKEVATLDSLSGGRVELGVGIGWLKEEFTALGVPWERRGPRTEEYIEVMRRVWADEVVSFDGEFVSFEDVVSSPKPVGGRVPIHIGGHSEAAARRAGRVGDGFYPAADCGRDPAALDVTSVHVGMFGDDPHGAIEELESWGVNRAVLPSFLYFRDTEDRLAEIGESWVAAHPD